MNSIFKISIIPIFLFFGLFSCNSTKQHYSKDEIIVISSGEYSEFSEKEHRVLKTQDAFNDVIQHISYATLPAINWKNQQVVLISLGTKNTGGFYIEAHEIIEEAKKIQINYRVIGPKAGDKVSMALTHPYLLLVLDNKKNLPVEFVEMIE